MPVQVDEAGDQAGAVQVDALVRIRSRGEPGAGRGDRVAVEQDPRVGDLATLVDARGGMEKQRHAASVAAGRPSLGGAPPGSEKRAQEPRNASVRTRRTPARCSSRSSRAIATGGPDSITTRSRRSGTASATTEAVSSGPSQRHPSASGPGSSGQTTPTAHPAASSSARYGSSSGRATAIDQFGLGGSSLGREVAELGEERRDPDPRGDEQHPAVGVAGQHEVASDGGGRDPVAGLEAVERPLEAARRRRAVGRRRRAPDRRARRRC